MKLVMVCTGNTCRSPLAEAIALDKMKKDDYFKDFQVASAGTHAMVGDSASSGSMTVARNHGLDLENHRSKPLSVYHMIEATRVYTMTLEQAELLKIRFSEYSDKIFPLSSANISDPYGQDAMRYEAVYHEIEEAIEALLEKLKGEEDDENCTR